MLLLEPGERSEVARDCRGGSGEKEEEGEGEKNSKRMKRCGKHDRACRGNIDGAPKWGRNNGTGNKWIRKGKRESVAGTARRTARLKGRSSKSCVKGPEDNAGADSVVTGRAQAGHTGRAQAGHTGRAQAGHTGRRQWLSRQPKGDEEDDAVVERGGGKKKGGGFQGGSESMQPSNSQQ